MVGGFMGVGTPERLLDELVRQKKSGGGQRPACVTEVIGLHYAEAAQSPHFNR